PLFQPRRVPPQAHVLRRLPQGCDQDVPAGFRRPVGPVAQEHRQGRFLPDPVDAVQVDVAYVAAVGGLDGPLLTVWILAKHVEPRLEGFQIILVRRHPDPEPLHLGIVDHFQALGQIFPPQRAQAASAPHDELSGHGWRSPPSRNHLIKSGPERQPPPAGTAGKLTAARSYGKLAAQTVDAEEYSSGLRERFAKP